MDENIKRLPPNLTVHGLVNHLNGIVEEIDEIYVVVRDRNGDVFESMIGDMKGLAFAILVLQKYALDAMVRQQHG